MNQKIIHAALAFLFVALLITAPRAQQTAPAIAKQSTKERVALYQALLDLTNPWTVMCVAAHPDDEDGTSLIVMRHKYGAHTVSLFSTFGEGGQNAIGPELYEELGAIRARETMAAAEIQGSEPYFLGLKDFGYSKSADEAFRVWGHDEALRRMVLQIRKLRPDVIITNHSVTNNDHGHHQATARLVLEAFDAAADPKRFPEQLKDNVTTWQVQRLFVRARGNTGQKPDREGGREQIVTIDPNERDPVRGIVYAEEALRALQKHATQGPWPRSFAEFAARFRSFTGQNAAPGQLPLIRYVLVREAKGAEELPKDLHNLLDGLRLPEPAKAVVDLLKLQGSEQANSAELKARFLPKLTELIKSKRFAQITKVDETSRTVGNDSSPGTLSKRLQTAFIIAEGISVKLASHENVLIPGRPTDFSLIISNGNLMELKPKSFFSGVADDSQQVKMYMDAPSRITVNKGQITAVFAEGVPKNAPPTIPHSEHLYDQRFAGVAVAVGGLFEIKGVDIPIFASTYVDVALPIEIPSVSPSLVMLTPATVSRGVVFIANVVNNDGQRHTGRLVAVRSTDRLIDYGDPLSLQPGARLQVKLPTRSVLALPSSDSATATTLNSFNISVSWRDDRKALESVPRSVPVVYADAHVAPNLRVGYLRGFDYSLPNALNALGVESKELTVDEVKTADLHRYSTIIVDNRVYESQPELIAANQRLLDYTKDGGTLIVFYHKSFEWNPDERRNRPQLAPYKLILGDERITDENAPVTFIEPQHPLFNVPNKLGQEDFAGWIQERGLYYPKDWDAQFHALLQSNDPGEQPLRGGLLVADYGRGRYIYTSMVWYRQLRAGVPGAYRMLANMISYGRESR